MMTLDLEVRSDLSFSAADLFWLEQTKLQAENPRRGPPPLDSNVAFEQIIVLER